MSLVSDWCAMLSDIRPGMGDEATDLWLTMTGRYNGVFISCLSIACEAVALMGGKGGLERRRKRQSGVDGRTGREERGRVFQQRLFVGQ